MGPIYLLQLTKNSRLHCNRADYHVMGSSGISPILVPVALLSTLYGSISGATPYSDASYYVYRT
jgi:hypothetical protein